MLASYPACQSRGCSISVKTAALRLEMFQGDSSFRPPLKMENCLISLLNLV